MAQVTHSEESTVQNLIRECYDVAHWASSCAVRCIENANEDGMDICARFCLDAEGLARALAGLAARGSPHATNIAECTKGVLADCADQCSKLASRAGDGQRTMENCAQACRTAIESCDAFVKTGR